MKDQTNLRYDSENILRANTFTAPKGKVFAGWAIQKNTKARYENKQKVENLTDTDQSIVTLYAKWVTVKRYTINYYLNGGKSESSLQTSYKSGTGDILPIPTKAGYLFAGWYSNRKLTGNAVTVVKPWDFGKKFYYAKWVKK